MAQEPTASYTKKGLVLAKYRADASIHRYHLDSNPMATALSGAPVNTRGQHVSEKHNNQGNRGGLGVGSCT